MNMHHYLLLIAAGTLLSITSCTKKEEAISRCPVISFFPIIQMAKTKAEAALNAASSQHQIEAAKKGIAWSDKCVRLYPKEEACYYYRAVNRGLFYEAAPFGYQKGLKKIIGDCQKVIALDEAYEGGGAYRILGNIYLKSPSFTLSRRGVTRDLDKAGLYAAKALEIDPDDLDNLLLQAEVFLEEVQPEEALPLLRDLVKEYQNKGSLRLREQKNKKRVIKLLSHVEKNVEKKLTKNGIR